MTPSQAKQLKEAIRKLAMAEIANSWKGGSYAEDFPIIVEELRCARIRVALLITRFTQSSPKESIK